MQGASSQQDAAKNGFNAAVSTFLVQYHSILSKGQLTPGAITKLLQHQDNRLAEHVRRLVGANNAVHAHATGMHHSHFCIAWALRSEHD